MSPFTSYDNPALACQVNIFPDTGVVTSPQFPRRYPNNVDETQTIQVEQGKILVLDFTYFAVKSSADCEDDHIKVTDGDGSILMDNSCGYSSYKKHEAEYFKPPKIITMSNIVHLYFKTDTDGTRTGWSVTWRAVRPGGFLNNHPRMLQTKFRC